MTHRTILNGITWNHSRGFVSVVATAQRFSEMNPHVEINWKKRSLQEFADAPLQNLAQHYDLLVIDHPWAGFAAASGVLLPLQDHIEVNYLKDQADNSVGYSHISYEFDGDQCALAIDAATPVASYRADLMGQYDLAMPHTWDDLLELARKGRVVMPGIPIDTLMNFYMLCSTQGQDPIVNGEWVVADDLAMQSLEQLRELTNLCPPEIFGYNPIAVYETLSRDNQFVYCPFAYGYSNYARRGYSKYVLTFTDMIDIGGKGRCRTTLGGTGLAISANCQSADVAVEYTKFTANPLVQQTIFVENGGQPGHRRAWVDEEVNRRTNNYFANTLPALDRAYLRPRFPGYLDFQDRAGDPIRDWNINGGNPKNVLDKLKTLFQQVKDHYSA